MSSVPPAVRRSNTSSCPALRTVPDLQQESAHLAVRAGSAQVDGAITVDRLLDQLAQIKPDWCMLVEVKYFLGLTDEEAAETLGLKLRSMQRMWRDARQWLFEQMESGNAKQSAGR